MLNNLQENEWITPQRKSENIKLRLFCFPYAGGSSTIFHNWQKLFPFSIQVCPVNLPGRGNRFAEELRTDFFSLVKEIKDGIAPFFDYPFVFFGHSMGGILAFELARLLRRLGLPQPAKLFISGCGAAQISYDKPREYDLSENGIIKDLKNLKGTPAIIFENEELLQVMLPIIRADYKVCQAYIYYRESPLDIPLVAIGGREDDAVPKSQILSWREQTRLKFKSYFIDGDHFFCHTHEEELTQILIRELYQFIRLEGF